MALKGCKRPDLAERNRQNATHGMTISRSYYSWMAMKKRCYREEDISYHNYGGRGIYVCDRWKNSFENFLEDMGIRPDGRELDRIDVNGGYSKENCRWATKKENSSNKRNSFFITHESITKTLAQWAKEKNMYPSTLQRRILSGWPIEHCLNKPSRETKK